MQIRIADKIIGPKYPCFIIAEAGVNHNGKLELAKKLVDAAKYAGADAVKFQTFKAEKLVTKNSSMAEYQQKNLNKRQSQYDLLKKLELNYKNFSELKRYCDKKKIIFLSTPHSDDAIDFLDDLIPAYKLGSGDITNFPFLEKVAKKKKPVILSTGMSTLEEVRKAVKFIYGCGNKQVVALHCTSNYPCSPEEVNLRAMLTMQKKLDCLVGYSDHTTNVITPAIAVALGAVVVEKHFTLDTNLSGPDHKASLEPDELKETVGNIRYAEMIMGSKEKKPTKSEKKIMPMIRKSIVATADIQKGEKITKDKIIIKRPGTGISPKHLNKVLGKISQHNLKKDELLEFKKLK